MPQKGNDMKFEIYEEAAGLGLLSGISSGQYRWRLRADNGKIIANSGEGYHNKADCIHGINLVASSNGTVIEDQTAKLPLWMLNGITR